MAKIAESFEKDEHKQIYRTALKKFRLPYWDYYKPRGGQVSFVGVMKEEKTTFPYDYRIPDIFTKDTIMIRTVETKNEPRPMPNPLMSFKFPPEESDASIWVRHVTDRRGNPMDMQVSRHTFVVFRFLRRPS
jgi:tyrosinase